MHLVSQCQTRDDVRFDFQREGVVLSVHGLQPSDAPSLGLAASNHIVGWINSLLSSFSLFGKKKPKQTTKQKTSWTLNSTAGRAGEQKHESGQWRLTALALRATLPGQAYHLALFKDIWVVIFVHRPKSSYDSIILGVFLMYTATLLCNSLRSFQIINNHITVHTDLLKLILKVLIPWSSGHWFKWGQESSCKYHI